MKRLSLMLLVLALALSLAVPALGAEGEFYRYYGGVQLTAGKQTVTSRYLVRECSGDGANTFYRLERSSDGISWTPLPTRMTQDMMAFQETGRALVYYCTYTGEVYYYNGGDDWVRADLGFDPAEGLGNVWASYTFRGTDSGYLMCQNISERRMMGINSDGVSPRNTMVTLLDMQFKRVGDYDFGAPVLDVAYALHAYYAKVQEGAEGTAVYQSTDGQTWSKTDLTDLPPAQAEWSAGIKDCRAGDIPLAAGLARLEGGVLYYSKDGVYFAPVTATTAAKLHAAVGQGGAVLSGLDADGNPTGEHITMDYARWGGVFPDPVTYLTVDGAFVSSYDTIPYPVRGCTMAPMRPLAEAMGLDFSYDAATQTATCTGEGVEIKVKLGGTTATVNGVSKQWLAVPAEMKGWRFCVPVRFLAEAAGLAVTWDGDSHAIYMTRPAV